MGLAKARWAMFLLAICVVTLLAYGAWSFQMSALDEPGPAVTFLATKAKHFYIGLAARQIRVVPPSSPASIAVGEMAYHGECQNCHGTDGRTPTEIGRSLYPRAPSLVSPQVQRWSDPELFVIIRDGIRHSGMPGFGRAVSENQIWDLVRFVRSLQKSS
jgi:mono/diheme cytochrome c family protein